MRQPAHRSFAVTLLLLSALSGHAGAAAPGHAEAGHPGAPHTGGPVADLISDPGAGRATHPGPGPGPDQATSHRRFDDVTYWATVFDDPARAAWQKPDELVAALALRPGQCVADLGAGTGYFSRRLSAAVGATGTVLAVEVEPNLVTHLRDRAEREGTANVVPVLGSTDRPRLPPGLVDLVLIVDTYHHLDDRRAYFRALAAILRPGGRVAIVDWKREPLPVGPELDHKLAREQVVQEMGDSGYRLSEDLGILPHQYFLIFTAP